MMPALARFLTIYSTDPIRNYEQLQQGIFTSQESCSKAPRFLVYNLALYSFDK